MIRFTRQGPPVVFRREEQPRFSRATDSLDQRAGGPPLFPPLIQSRVLEPDWIREDDDSGAGSATLRHLDAPADLVTVTMPVVGGLTAAGLAVDHSLSSDAVALVCVVAAGLGIALAGAGEDPNRQAPT
ncbi:MULTISPECIES: hypothetical protein [Hydrogenophaga]|uniref:Uncharacterized protein n=1 Tax=Hydrogenophaga intermedia TaxID=65786 RepID=A0A1L1PCD0_HYDIT|nr:MULTISPECIES: hypothetical protein [Hydrogenophaga]AOS78184.1 hypothetical protein Q5W_03915 [Hydrogenophaga sp. PBC]TMU76380.1 hypothetical protein FGJ01_06625 [Hydrogenophaga intermedia]CDN87608.1 hypothetical protein BN948_02030 [Hydrogenophaga intermedia]